MKQQQSAPAPRARRASYQPSYRANEAGQIKGLVTRACNGPRAGEVNHSPLATELPLLVASGLRVARTLQGANVRHNPAVGVPMHERKRNN